MSPATFVYRFSWDVSKAQSNWTKHRVTFTTASTVFQDALAISVFDHEHSESEDRWITMGRAANSRYIVVVHTWHPIDATSTAVRLISAREATRAEIRDYEENRYERPI